MDIYIQRKETTYTCNNIESFSVTHVFEELSNNNAMGFQVFSYNTLNAYYVDTKIFYTDNVNATKI